jgi:hypothetical protein
LKANQTCWTALNYNLRGNTMDKEQIENNFKYHSPIGNQPERYESIRNMAKGMAHFINSACPDSREKSLALTNLEQAVMWANASIARNE